METLELIEWVVGRFNLAYADGDFPACRILNRILHVLIEAYLKENHA